MSMVQFLSFIPLMNWNIPGVFSTFINSYLTVTGITIPFAMIPVNYLNPLYLLSNFITPPFNSKFFDCGFNSVSLIYNFANQLFTWITLLLIYFLLIFLTRYFTGKKYA